MAPSPPSAAAVHAAAFDRATGPPAAPAVAAVGEPAFGPFGEPAIMLGMPFFVGLVVDRVGGGPASTAARISSGFSRRLAIRRSWWCKDRSRGTVGNWWRWDLWRSIFSILFTSRVA